MPYSLSQLAALDFAREVLATRANELLSVAEGDYHLTSRFLRANAGAMELGNIIIQHELAHRSATEDVSSQELFRVSEHVRKTGEDSRDPGYRKACGDSAELLYRLAQKRELQERPPEVTQ